MEDAYERFDSYDFEADARFQSGAALADSCAGADIKLFYYNRFIEPIDPAGYRRWRGGGGGGRQRETECDEAGDEDHQNETLSEPEPGGEGGGGDPGEPKVLSFAEVMRLVQAGEPVPGLVDSTQLDIAPSNQNPTPSQMERVLKPWETH